MLDVKSSTMVGVIDDRRTVGFLQTKEHAHIKIVAIILGKYFTKWPEMLKAQEQQVLAEFIGEERSMLQDVVARWGSIGSTPTTLPKFIPEREAATKWIMENYRVTPSKSRALRNFIEHNHFCVIAPDAVCASNAGVLPIHCVVLSVDSQELATLARDNVASIRAEITSSEVMLFMISTTAWGKICAHASVAALPFSDSSLFNNDGITLYSQTSTRETRRLLPRQEGDKCHCSCCTIS